MVENRQINFPNVSKKRKRYVHIIFEVSMIFIILLNF